MAHDYAISFSNFHTFTSRSSFFTFRDNPSGIVCRITPGVQRNQRRGETHFEWPDVPQIPIKEKRNGKLATSTKNSSQETRFPLSNGIFFLLFFCSGRQRVFEELNLNFQTSNIAKGTRIKQITKGSEILKPFQKAFTIVKPNPTFSLFQHVFFSPFSAIFIVCLFNQMVDCYKLYRFIVRRCYCWAPIGKMYRGWRTEEKRW